jgi:hypothetical protein
MNPPVPKYVRAELRDFGLSDEVIDTVCTDLQQTKELVDLLENASANELPAIIAQLEGFTPRDSAGDSSDTPKTPEAAPASKQAQAPADLGGALSDLPELPEEPEYVKPFRPSSPTPKPTPDALSESAPQDSNAEKATLASILVADPTRTEFGQRWVLDEIGKHVTPESFYGVGNQKTYAAILRLDERRVPIDVTTLISELHDAGQLEDVGGREYLIELATQEATALNGPHYAAIVAKKERQRELLSLAINLQQATLNGGDTAHLIERINTFRQEGKPQTGHSFAPLQLLPSGLPPVPSLNDPDDQEGA